VRAATDNDPKTGIFGGAAKGAVVGGAAGVLAGKYAPGALDALKRRGGFSANAAAAVSRSSARASKPAWMQQLDE